MPFKHCNGIDIYYEMHGKGEPLILISGLGGDHTFWQPSVEILASRFRVIIYDVRGSGKSAMPNSPYSMDIFSDDLLALMNALKIEKANILGFSMGGCIALQFSLNHPERLLKLIVAVSYAVMPVQSRLFLDAVLAVYKNGASTKQMFDLVCPWLFSRQFLSDPANKPALRYDENDVNPQPLFAWKNQYLATTDYNITKEVSAIETPTLIMAGEEDRLSPVEDAILLHKAISCSELITFQGAGHLINYENPDLFHKLAIDFISK